MTSDNLWPTDLSTTEPSGVLPITILREQAIFFTESTTGILTAQVVTSKDVNSNFSHNFYIIAPALANYKYLLLTVKHGIDLYPINTVGVGRAYGAPNETQFKENLKEIFALEQTRKIVNSLLLQSKEQP